MPRPGLVVIVINGQRFKGPTAEAEVANAPPHKRLSPYQVTVSLFIQELDTKYHGIGSVTYAGG